MSAPPNTVSTPAIVRLGSGSSARFVAEEPYRVIEGTPDARLESPFAEGALQAGVAICKACTVELAGYPHDEYCFLLEGRLVITAAGGVPEQFQPGDAFLLPRGFKGRWEMPDGIRKYVVVLAS